MDISFDIANLADNLQSSETATQVFGLGMCLLVVDLGGMNDKPPLSPTVSIFIQFSTKSMPNNR